MTSVPAPSTAIEPPSRTSGASTTSVAEALGEQRADAPVAVVGRELLAPGVEAEVHPDARSAARRRDEDRSAVAQPRVVDRELDDLDVAGAARARVGASVAPGRRPSSPARTRRSASRDRRVCARARVLERSPHSSAGTARRSASARAGPTRPASAARRPRQPSPSKRSWWRATSATTSSRTVRCPPAIGRNHGAGALESLGPVEQDPGENERLVVGLRRRRVGDRTPPDQAVLSRSWTVRR